MVSSFLPFRNSDIIFLNIYSKIVSFFPRLIYMEDLQELQDLQNQKIEQLKEKLKEINIVSFNEYESESIDSPVEKKREN